MLSPSTERYDSAEKWSMLMREPSLQHYVLIDQHSVLVEHRWRGEDGVWRIEHRGPGQQLELGALGLSLSVDALYEDVLDVMVPRARLRPVAAVF